MHKKVMVLPEFESAVGDIMEAFIKEKMGCGYSYAGPMQALRRFDRFLHANGLNAQQLPKPLMLEWSRKTDHEAPRTHQGRVQIACQFARYMQQRGYDAYLAPSALHPIVRRSFAPYIFTVEEMRRLFDESDRMQNSRNSPNRHLIAPVLFRLLYGCGLRVNEALRLTVADVDLQQGILTIRNSKFKKDRLVPVAPELLARLCTLKSQLGHTRPEAFYFPARDGGRYSKATIYDMFRALLHKAGIAHGGYGKGPRVHDMRHNAEFRIMPSR